MTLLTDDTGPRSPRALAALVGSYDVGADAVSAPPDRSSSTGSACDGSASRVSVSATRSRPSRAGLRISTVTFNATCAGPARTGRHDLDPDATALSTGTGSGSGPCRAVVDLDRPAGSRRGGWGRRTGSGEGDDVQIRVDGRSARSGRRDPVRGRSYQGHSLSWVANAYFRLVDDPVGRGARRGVTLTWSVTDTGAVLALLRRTPSGWALNAVGEGVPITRADARDWRSEPAFAGASR